MSEINFDYKKMYPFKWFILENFPFLEDGIDRLTNYQLLVKLGEEINKNRDAINDIGENEELVVDAFNTLHNYVENYFENLDLQEEVNNKLDKMASDGTLDSLLEPYVSQINNRVNTLELYLNNEIDDLTDKINALNIGAPLVASSTSGMTDTDRVYVNSTDGKWYYYNGSAWVVGGTYQGTQLSENDVNYENLSTRLQSELGYHTDTYTDTSFNLHKALAGSTGLEYDSNYRFTTGFLSLDYIKITGLNTYQYNIYKYSKTNLAYIGNEGWKAIDDSYYSCSDSNLYKISFQIGDGSTTEVDETNMDDVSIINYKIQNNVSIFNLDSTLKSQMKMDPVTMYWEIGTISGTGADSSSDYRLRTIGYYQFDSQIIVKNNPVFSLYLFEYNSDMSFNHRVMYINYSNIIITPDPSKYYRFIYLNSNDAQYEMHLSDLDNLSITGYKKDTTITLPDEYLNSMDNLDFTFNSHGFNQGSYASGITMVKDLLVEFGISSDDHASYSVVNLYKIDMTLKTASYVRSLEHNFGHVNSVDYCSANDTLVFGNGSGSFEQKGKFYVYEDFYDKISDNEVEQLSISDAIEYDCTPYEIGNEYKFNCCWADGNGGNYDTIILVTNNYRNIRKIQLGTTTHELELGTYNSSATNFNGTFKIIKEYSQTTGDATGTDNTYAVQDLSYFDGKLYGGVGHNINTYWIMTLNNDGTITRDEKYIDITNTSGVEQNLSVGNMFVTRNYMICFMNKYLVFNK